MIKAKDTVLPYLQVSNQIPITLLEFIAKLEAQAEISFKVGKTAGVAESLIPSLKAIEASRKAGMKEVVEWIGAERHSIGRSEQHYINEYRWQAKLKDWGIGK